MADFRSFKKIILHPIKYRVFMLNKLPMAFIAGLRVVELTEEKAIASVKYKWLTQNPFKSIYFAVLSMAAELSTGILSFAYTYKNNPAISMLVIKTEGDFYKKAIGKILFTCNDGHKIKDAIQQAIFTKEPVTITCESIGLNIDNEIVAKFFFKWSFKIKKASK